MLMHVFPVGFNVTFTAQIPFNHTSDSHCRRSMRRYLWRSSPPQGDSFSDLRDPLTEFVRRMFTSDDHFTHFEGNLYHIQTAFLGIQVVAICNGDLLITEGTPLEVKLYTRRIQQLQGSRTVGRLIQLEGARTVPAHLSCVALTAMQVCSLQSC